MKSRFALTTDQLTRMAPAIYATAPSAKTSARYTFVPTATIISDLAEHGWVPVAAQQQGTRSLERRGIAKHMVRFAREADIAAQSVKLQAPLPEIVLFNSHDGLSSYQMSAGIYRLVCANGLVVSDKTFATQRIRHSNNERSDIIEASFRVLKSVPQLADKAQSFGALTLTHEARLEFARRVAAELWPTKEERPVHHSRLLSIRRYGDDNPDLWTTLNVVQENVIRGGLKDYSIRKPDGAYFPRTTAIKSIDRQRDLNQMVWAQAEIIEAEFKPVAI